jgi:hypothetical protein
MNTRGMILLKNNGRSQTNAPEAVDLETTLGKFHRCRKLTDLEFAGVIPDLKQRIHKQIPFLL